MKVNGVTVAVPTGLSLLAYLQQQGYPLDRIAVEYNGDILARAAYGAIQLQPDDVVEIVCFVGGG